VALPDEVVVCDLRRHCLLGKPSLEKCTEGKMNRGKEIQMDVKVENVSISCYAALGGRPFYAVFGSHKLMLI